MSKLIKVVHSRLKTGTEAVSITGIKDGVDAILKALSETKDWEEGDLFESHNHYEHESEVSVTIEGIEWIGVGLYGGDILDSVEDIEFDGVVDIQKTVL